MRRDSPALIQRKANRLPRKLVGQTRGDLTTASLDAHQELPEHAHRTLSNAVQTTWPLTRGPDSATRGRSGDSAGPSSARSAGPAIELARRTPVYFMFLQAENA